MDADSMINWNKFFHVLGPKPTEMLIAKCTKFDITSSRNICKAPFPIFS